jgi:predicted HicB family RNase H-like nuclease
MARPKAKPKEKKADMSATAEQPVAPATKPVRLDLSPEDHYQLRLEAAKAQMSMASFARKLFLEALRKKLN